LSSCRARPSCKGYLTTSPHSPTARSWTPKYLMVTRAFGRKSGRQAWTVR
jgi:hypothetical protein